MANTQLHTDKWRQWLLNSAFSAALAIGGLYFNSVEAEHVREAADLMKFRAESVLKDQSQSERILVLETKLVYLTSLVERMDVKLDKLPERIRK
jgi:hypothetical protein